MFNAVVFGIGCAAGGFLGGPLLETLGGRGLFLVYAAITFSVLALGVFLGSVLPAEKAAPISAIETAP
jgi:predicted MFS family arabinose efflux permease